MRGEWQAQIYEQFGGFNIHVTLYRELGEKIEIIQPDHTAKLVDRGDAVEPSFIFNDRSQLQALANALNNFGVNPQKEYTEGKLEATEAHLSDLRQMLKLK